MAGSPVDSIVQSAVVTAHPETSFFQQSPLEQFGGTVLKVDKENDGDDKEKESFDWLSNNRKNNNEPDPADLIRQALGIKEGDDDNAPKTKTKVNSVETSVNLDEIIAKVQDKTMETFNVKNFLEAFDTSVKDGTIAITGPQLAEDFSERMEEGDYGALTDLIQQAQVMAIRNAVAQTMGLMQNSLPEILKEYASQYTSTVSKTEKLNKGISDVEISEELMPVAQMLAEKYVEAKPEATAEEIKENVNKALKALNNKKESETKVDQSKQEFDWSKLNFSDL